MSEIIINELLCYTRCKFDLVTIKQLKLVLLSFYTEDELSCSKQLLHDAASKVIDSFPRLIKRSKSDNRVKLLVEDITEYLLKIDECQCWDKLPIYVAQNLARIPTVPIEEIEIFIMSQKLERLDSRMKKLEVESALAENVISREGPVISGGVNLTANKEIPTGAMCDSANANSASGEGEGSWSTVVRRGVKKSSKASVKVVGCNKVQNSSIEAAKSLQRKFIFHLDNVKADLPCSDIESFISNNGVNVINCFSAKSWIHFKPDAQESCHAFRVCIKYEDKPKVLDEAFWPNGVMIREWRFKKSNQDGEH
jgi:hypothetical protein